VKSGCKESTALQLALNAAMELFTCAARTDAAAGERARYLRALQLAREEQAEVASLPEAPAALLLRLLVQPHQRAVHAQPRALLPHVVCVVWRELLQQRREEHRAQAPVDLSDESAEVPPPTTTIPCVRAWYSKSTTEETRRLPASTGAAQQLLLMFPL
jgi:hypothetical protein